MSEFKLVEDEIISPAVCLAKRIANRNKWLLVMKSYCINGNDHIETGFMKLLGHHLNADETETYASSIDYCNFGDDLESSCLKLLRGWCKDVHSKSPSSAEELELILAAMGVNLDE